MLINPWNKVLNMDFLGSLKKYLCGLKIMAGNISLKTKHKQI